jgi:RimJ/RimL family protein N-acetyltransferase
MSEKEQKEAHVPFIEGTNVDLVPVSLTHIEMYTRWINDSRVRRYSRNSIPHTLEEVKKWFEPQEGFSRWVSFEVWHKKDKKPIGTCGFGRINWVDRNANIYMSIGEPEYWNKNLGTEASKLLIDYGFKELNFVKIYAGIFEPNIGSWSVAEKDGFVLEGKMKRSIYIDGEYVDTRRYRIFKEDWINKDK